jgi:hypothetical protein
MSELEDDVTLLFESALTNDMPELFRRIKAIAVNQGPELQFTDAELELIISNCDNMVIVYDGLLQIKAKMGLR